MQQVVRREGLAEVIVDAGLDCLGDKFTLAARRYDDERRLCQRLVGTDLVAEVETECGLVAETALVRPQIITGRNDVTGSRGYAAADPLTPVRVRIADLGIDAAVSPAGIDVKAGVLDVPAAISRLGWWLDGQLPGSKSGAVLIAGHVDYRPNIMAIFWELRGARPGDVIDYYRGDGVRVQYAVDWVQHFPAAFDVNTLRANSGPETLTLISCGGVFSGVADEEMLGCGSPRCDVAGGIPGRS